MPGPRPEVPNDQIRPAAAEQVNHPAHYGGDTPHEVIKCLSAWGLLANACLFNVVKYVARAGLKGSRIEDLRKARWYLDYEITRLEAESVPTVTTTR